jgi:hypothetical protein
LDLGLTGTYPDWDRHTSLPLGGRPGRWRLQAGNKGGKAQANRATAQPFANPIDPARLGLKSARPEPVHQGDFLRGIEVCADFNRLEANGVDTSMCRINRDLQKK